MNKKIALCLTASLFALSSILVMGSEYVSLTYANVGNEKWMHYAKREATSELDGIREYWALCGGARYVFSEPQSGTIEEGRSYDTSEFTTNDPRWIKWVDEGKEAFYSYNDNDYDFSEVGKSFYGYKALNFLKEEVGNTGRYEFYKDDFSPIYSASCLSVTDTIGSNDDLVSFCKAIDSKEVNGYYVLTNNLSSPTAYVNNSDGKNLFSGTFDGRNHIISNPIFWGKRLLGTVKNATIKNLSFKDISVYSVLAERLTNVTIENCSFMLSNNINQYSGIGVLCDNIEGKMAFKNVTIDMGEKSLKCSWSNMINPSIAAFNLADENGVTYENVTIRSLNSQKVYVHDTLGRSLRPAEINYISTYQFLKNGVFNYKIRYQNGNSDMQEAGNLISEEITKATGKQIEVLSYSDSDSFSIDSSEVLLGQNSLATSIGVSLRSEIGSYSLVSAGKAILLSALEGEGYHSGAIRLLEELIGYNYIGDGITTYNVPDKNNIVLPFWDISYVPSFGYRKCDWSDDKAASWTEDDCYRFGYNAGYGSRGYYIGTPAVGSLTNPETFHTSLHILYPGTYYSSHSKWYAEDEKGNNYGEKYQLWQLCFSAHGDESEYQSMVSETAKGILSVFKNANNKKLRSILFGTEDNHNYCHCSTCTNLTASYGSITGTVVKFVNDVRNKVFEGLSSIGRDSVDIGLFAYLAYKAAPLKNGSPTITLADNVYVLAAPIEANYTLPLTNGKNTSSKAVIDDWCKIGTVSAWLYDTNFSHYLYPFNSFRANAENLSYLESKGVGMVYLQGQHNAPQPRTGFNALKKYLASRLMMNTSLSYESLVSDFFSSYYGEGGEIMRSFFNAMVTRLESIESNSRYQSTLYNNSQSSIYQTINKRTFWDYDELMGWVNKCNEAYKLAATEKAKKHIQIESVFPRFALAELFTRNTDWGSVLNGAVKLKEFRQELKTLMDTLGFKITCENGTQTSTYFSDWGV